MYDVDPDTFAIELRFVQSELWARIGLPFLTIRLSEGRLTVLESISTDDGFAGQTGIPSIAKVYRDLVLEETPEQLVPGSAPGASSSPCNPVHPTTTDLRLRTLLERARDVSQRRSVSQNSLLT